MGATSCMPILAFLELCFEVGTAKKVMHLRTAWKIGGAIAAIALVSYCIILHPALNMTSRMTSFFEANVPSSAIKCSQGTMRMLASASSADFNSACKSGQVSASYRCWLLVKASRGSLLPKILNAQCAKSALHCLGPLWAPLQCWRNAWHLHWRPAE